MGLKQVWQKTVSKGMAIRAIEPAIADHHPQAEGSWSLDLSALPARVLRWSLIAVALLTILHVLTTDLVFVDFLGVDERFDAEVLRDLFRLQREQSLPTWYSGVLLLGCASALLLISTRADSSSAPPRVAWLSLGLIFVALSIDEQIGFHEVVSRSLRDVVETGGVLRFAWVIPGAGFAALAGLLYWRFFKVLPSPYPLLFFGAGAIFLSGALIAEMLEASLVSSDAGRYELGLSFLLQDPLEMIGASVFLYALLRYGVERLGWRRLSIGS